MRARHLGAVRDELVDHARQHGVRAARVGHVALEAGDGGDAAHLVRVGVSVRLKVRVRVGVRARVRARARVRVGGGDAAHEGDELQVEGEVRGEQRGGLLQAARRAELQAVACAQEAARRAELRAPQLRERVEGARVEAGRLAQPEGVGDRAVRRGDGLHLGHASGDVALAEGVLELGEHRDLLRVGARA